MLHARSARSEDFVDYLFLRMDLVNIQWTGHSDAPDLRKLQIWYLEKLTDENRKIILFYDAEGVVGYLYLDWIANESCVEIAYGIHSKYSGRGYGKEVVEFAVHNAKKYFADTKKISAWIADENIGSVRCALNANMNKEGEAISRLLPSFDSQLTFTKYIKQID